jgi:hypothetical protein
MAPLFAYATLVGLIVPTTFSILLLVANANNWHSSERFAHTVTIDKPTIAIVVQVLAYSLGLFQICALCNYPYIIKHLLIY